MDLSFSLSPRGWALLGRASLADIKAAADRRVDYATSWSDDGSPAVKSGQQGSDWVHVLACSFAPDRKDSVDMSSLGGSFNPLIARQLMVGQSVKATLTFGL